MYIFQPDRELLEKQILEYSQYVTGRVLDVGAGEFSRYQKSFKYTEYIKIDNKKSFNVDIVANADNIPFLNESFDSVVCTQVFEHLNNPEKAATEIYRVLKRGGYCLITAPQMNELHEEPNDFFRYTKYGLIEIFKKQGFSIIRYSQRGGYFTMTAQLKIRYCIDRFNIYNKPLLGKIFSKFFKIYGKFMIWLDKIDNSKTNKKHTLGWAFIFKK